MGDLIQFRPRINQKANKAFWMGHTGRDGKGAMLTGPVLVDVPDDLTMSRADPELDYPDSGDCA